MSVLFERVSYLRGLADGLDLDKSKKEAKLLAEIVNVLEEMAYAIEDVEGNLEEMDEFVDAINEGLTDLEDDFYSDEEFDTFECPDCGTEIFISEDEFDEDLCAEVRCPGCGSEFVVCDDDEEDCCCCGDDCDCDDECECDDDCEDGSCSCNCGSDSEK